MFRHRLLWRGGLALLVVAAACRDPTPTRVAEESLQRLEADAVRYDMDAYLTRHGVRSGIVHADTAYMYSDSSVVHMWGVDMTLFYDDGRARATVTAERGVLHQKTEEMVARGDVVLIILEPGRRIESPELHYDPAADQIWSDSSTVSIQDGEKTRGTCFRSDLEFRNFTVCEPRGVLETGAGAAGEPDGGT